MINVNLTNLINYISFHDIYVNQVTTLAYMALFISNYILTKLEKIIEKIFFLSISLKKVNLIIFS